MCCDMTCPHFLCSSIASGAAKLWHFQSGNHQEGSTRCSHSYLPARVLRSASDILLHIRLPVPRLGSGSQVSQYAQSSYSGHFPLISVWDMFKELTSLPVLGSCHSVYITLIQPFSGCERPHLISSCCHVDFLLLCTLTGTVFPPARRLCEERYESGAEWLSFSQELSMIIWDWH